MPNEWKMTTTKRKNKPNCQIGSCTYLWSDCFVMYKIAHDESKLPMWLRPATHQAKWYLLTIPNSLQQQKISWLSAFWSKTIFWSATDCQGKIGNPDRLWEDVTIFPMCDGIYMRITTDAPCPFGRVRLRQFVFSWHKGLINFHKSDV